MRNSFIATVCGVGGGGNHKGAFSRGKYEKGKGFVPGKERTDSGKVRITQLMGVSAFGMGVYKTVSQDVKEYMGREVTARVHGILTSRVNRIAAKNK